MKLEADKTAVLTLDIQNVVVNNIPNSDSVLATAGRAADFARANNFKLIHVGLGFSPGHPEIPATHPRWSRIKQMNGAVIGTPSAEFHPSVYRPGDTVVHKHRMGAFTENQLELVLRSQGIRNLVLFGIASSGIVLSTLRSAFDLDYTCVVLADACFDPDPEVHRVLTQKVFTMQAAVLDVDTFIAAQSA
jgi:nicotinamidase-related amidase